MKKTRLLLGVAGAAAIAAGAYLAGLRQQAGNDAAHPETAADDPGYNYEATGVVVRQMGADGKLMYQIEAERVQQLPADGKVSASKLTLHYDPREGGDDAARERQRWTLTADAAELPESGDIVSLRGKVMVSGRPAESSIISTLTTERLDYNLQNQDLRTDAPWLFRWGRNQMQGSGLRANIKQGTLTVESRIHGKFAP
jgi:LPS export ABC transporter protein LptC